MKSAPSWGTRSILQVNWVFDEYFVRPKIWEEVFKPYGVGALRVLHHRTGVEIDSVVQLVTHNLAEVDVERLGGEVCASCARVKYLPVTRGFPPNPLGEFSGLAKSSQYFGSGANAFRLVLASKALYESIKASGIKGVAFSPCHQTR